MTKVQAQNAQGGSLALTPVLLLTWAQFPSKFLNRADGLVFVRAVFRETYFYFPDNEVLSSLPLPRKTYGGGRGE